MKKSRKQSNRTDPLEMQLQDFLRDSPYPEYARVWAKKLEDYCNYLVREMDGDPTSILTILAFKLKRLRKSLLDPVVRSKQETKKAGQDLKTVITLLERAANSDYRNKSHRCQKNIDRAFKMISKNFSDWWG
jgi:hypothetical protein